MLERTILLVSWTLMLFPAAVFAQEAEESTNFGTLVVEVDPEDAQIYVDNRAYGTGRVEIAELEAGSYKIEARLRGYYTETEYVNLEGGERVEVEFDLDPIVGYLEVRSNLPNISVTLGDEELDAFPAELPVGIHRVTARRFGYASVTKRIAILENAVTTVQFDLEPVPFALEGLALSKKRFNPENPGSLGMTEISFTVTAPGSGSVIVVDSGGGVLYEQEVGPFTEWTQRVIWNGRTRAGEAVPDGQYEVVVRAEGSMIGSDETVSASLTELIEVNRRIVSRYRSIFSGASGLLYVPLAEPVGPGSTQVMTAALMYQEVGERWYAPLVMGARFGLGVPTELTVTAGPLISSEDEAVRVHGGAAFSWRYLQLPGRLSLGTVLSGSLASEVEGSFGGRDERTNPTGFGLQHPLTLYAGAFYLSLSPQLYYGLDPVDYGDSVERGGGFWGYLRGGIGYQVGSFSLALSGALRSVPFSHGIDWDPPVAVGLETHLRVPETPIYFSILGSVDLWEEKQVLKAGFGAGLIF